MVARYKEFGGHKACENDSASNPNNQSKQFFFNKTTDNSTNQNKFDRESITNVKKPNSFKKVGHEWAQLVKGK